MTSQTVPTKYIPKQFITKPNFERGTMGKDLGSSTAPAPV